MGFAASRRNSHALQMLTAFLAAAVAALAAADAAVAVPDYAAAEALTADPAYIQGLLRRIYSRYPVSAIEGGDQAEALREEEAEAMRPW